MSEPTRERLSRLGACRCEDNYGPNTRCTSDCRHALARLALRLWDERDEARKKRDLWARTAAKSTPPAVLKSAEAEVARLRKRKMVHAGDAANAVLRADYDYCHDFDVPLDEVRRSALLAALMRLAPAEEPAPEATCHSCGHIESAHLHEIHEGARWCDVHECPCPNYAALATAGEPADEWCGTCGGAGWVSVPRYEFDGVNSCGGIETRHCPDCHDCFGGEG